MVEKKEIIRWILLEILVGVITRLSDFFDYDRFLSLSSISTLFGSRIFGVHFKLKKAIEYTNKLK